MRQRLLPRDPFAKLAYVWLIYLASPLSYLIFTRRGDAASVAEMILAVAIFLPLYFWSYWLDGWRVLLPLAGMTAIGAFLIPANPGAGVFFVYAGAIAWRVGRPSIASAVIAAIVGTILIEAGLTAIPTQSWGWAVVITVLIGGVVTYSADAGRKLRQAQEQTRRLAVIAERERIGRDLHDLLGHTLSVIALKAELASKLASRDPEGSLAEIRDVERISREALAEVRHAVQASRPAILADELHNARIALGAAGIEFIERTSPVSLDPVAEQALALALREAVTNVIRHAAAAQCVIQLSCMNGCARLEIRDDGIGGDAPLGSGLSGMRARLGDLGGYVERDGAKGTRLIITLPLSPAQRAVQKAESIA